MNEDELYYADFAKPDGLCDGEESYMPVRLRLAHRVHDILYFSYWIKTPGDAIVSCIDGLRPVIMKLEATDIE